MALRAGQSLFDNTHIFQYSFLLQTLSNDLYANRKSIHLLCVVMHIGALGDTVERFKIEVNIQVINGLINMGDGYNATSIIQLHRC